MKKSPKKAKVKAKSRTMSAGNDVEPKKRVFVLPDKILQAHNDDGIFPTLVKLRHPGSNKEAMFLFADDDTTVCEIKKFSQEPRSWFIDDSVLQDGSMFVATPVDPLFLILPYLKETKKFMRLEDILVDAEYPEAKRLASCQDVKVLLKKIADMKKNDDIEAYCLSSDRTLCWLKHKVDSLVTALKLKKVHVSKGAQSATYIAAQIKGEDTNVDDDSYLRYAHGMMSNYLSSDLGEKLRDHLGIQKDPEPCKEVTTPPAKKRKYGAGVEPTEDYSTGNDKSKKSNKPTKLSNAQRALNKVDKTGMKSISSFFTKK